MPEGPSILIIRDILAPALKGKKIAIATGNAKIDMTRLPGKKVINVQSWGKHLLIVLPDVTIRIHFLMFGTYSIDEHIRPDRSLRLKLVFNKKTIYFYTCSISLLEGDINLIYDWEGDVLNDKWNPRNTQVKLKNMSGAMVCDALLDQTVFAGVGNIIKNEVLYRIKLHPETLIGKIPATKLSALIKEARQYSFEFLKWKREFTLKKHWLAHTKKICSRCQLPLTKKHCGKTKRRSFFCGKCQVKY